MGQNFINYFSRVDKHIIYYVKKTVTMFDDLFLIIEHTISNYDDAKLNQNNYQKTEDD